MADEFDTGDMFKDPEGFYPPEKEPTFAEHRMLSGQTVRVRLVGSHPLYVHLPQTQTPVYAQLTSLWRETCSGTQAA
jgi:hypothetical protein